MEKTEIEKLEKLPITFILVNEHNNYKYKIKLNCTIDTYHNLNEKYDDLVSTLENKYGVLDGGGRLENNGWEIGYSSTEVKKKRF